MRCYQRVFNQQELPEKLLTGREIECLYWVANGKTDSEIATMLNLGRWTITSTMQSVKAKLGTTSRAAAAAIAVDSRIITLRRQA
jgi:DNA-binding CsgD family transcriptional regulator